MLDPLDDNDPCWLTPGGGLEDESESIRQAAVRELFEETGLLVDQADLGEPVGYVVVDGVPRTPVVQEDWISLFFNSFEPNTSGWEAPRGGATSRLAVVDNRGASIDDEVVSQDTFTVSFRTWSLADAHPVS